MHTRGPRERSLSHALISRLPTALLREIAETLGHSSIVVAFSARDHASARQALRDGVDESERKRIPGIAMTIRAAERRLRGEFGLDDACLESRDAAGDHLLEVIQGRTGDTTVPYQERGEAFDHTFTSGLFSCLLAFGANPNRITDDGIDFSPMHLFTQLRSSYKIDAARQLVAAGADLDFLCGPKDEYCAGRTPLAFAFFCMPFDAVHERMILTFASFLIENGADVDQANRSCMGYGRQRSLREHIERRVYHGSNLDAAQRLAQQIADALWLWSG